MTEIYYVSPLHNSLDSVLLSKLSVTRFSVSRISNFVWPDSLVDITPLYSECLNMYINHKSSSPAPRSHPIPFEKTLVACEETSSPSLGRLPLREVSSSG